MGIRFTKPAPPTNQIFGNLNLEALSFKFLLLPRVYPYTSTRITYPHCYLTIAVASTGARAAKQLFDDVRAPTFRGRLHAVPRGGRRAHVDVGSSWVRHDTRDEHVAAGCG